MRCNIGFFFFISLSFSSMNFVWGQNQTLEEVLLQEKVWVYSSQDTGQTKILQLLDADTYSYYEYSLNPETDNNAELTVTQGVFRFHSQDESFILHLDPRRKMQRERSFGIKELKKSQRIEYKYLILFDDGTTQKVWRASNPIQIDALPFVSLREFIEQNVDNPFAVYTLYNLALTVAHSKSKNFSRIGMPKFFDTEGFINGEYSFIFTLQLLRGFGSFYQRLNEYEDIEGIRLGGTIDVDFKLHWGSSSGPMSGEIEVSLLGKKGHWAIDFNQLAINRNAPSEGQYLLKNLKTDETYTIPYSEYRSIFLNTQLD